MSQITKLNLGCGQLVIPEAVNVDIWDGPGVNIAYDLNRLPWPFASQWFEEVWALDILEHLDDWHGVIQELHRVTKPGAILHVRMPAWDREQSYVDGTHKRFGTPETFTFWQPGHWRCVKYPQYHRGCFFLTHSWQRDGEEIVYVLERLP